MTQRRPDPGMFIWGNFVGHWASEFAFLITMLLLLLIISWCLLITYYVLGPVHPVLVHSTEKEVWARKGTSLTQGRVPASGRADSHHIGLFSCGAG